MTTNDVVAKRIAQLLREKHCSQYYIEQKSCIFHGSLDHIMRGTNNTIRLDTLYKIASGFDMTIREFLDDPMFDSETIEYL